MSVRVANAATQRFNRRVIGLIALAPLFLVFEVWQLVLSERYLGIKQIARGADPRTLGLGEITAFVWSLTIFSYWAWILLLFTHRLSRLHALGLLLVWSIGFMIRRGTSMKWVLVTLTFEGALRVGLLVSLCAMAWRRL